MSTYSPIATQTLSDTATSITFTNIPQGYTDLILRVDDQLSGASGYKIQFNGDANANYQQIQMGGYGTTASADKFLNRTSIYNNLVYGDSTTASVYTPNIIQIQNYSNAYAYKSLLWRYGTTTAAGGNGETFLIAGSWNSNSAIISITVSVWNNVNFVAGSSFNLYGIAAGSTKAQGGLVTKDNTYYYHTFVGSGVFTPYQTLTADVLVIAGGGGAGGTYGQGGGGAGGLVYSSSQSLSSNTNYNAIVGAGGNGAIEYASKGSNSTFTGGSLSLTTALGGGASAGNHSVTDGGSGAGGTYTDGLNGWYAGLGTSGQGNNGGLGLTTGGGDKSSGGGGGGAGAVGDNAGATQAGAGGIGSSTYSSWGSATSTGQLSSGTYYYAGGGGGGTDNRVSGNAGGAGGLGGGGAGGTDGATGTAALINTGGGGGGGGYNPSGPGTFGGNGGSGIVIVRYAI